MDSQDTTNKTAESTSDRALNVVKPNTQLPPGFQTRPQGLPGSPRPPLNNGPLGPRPGGQPPQIRRLDSRTTLGPPGSGQFVRPYGPPRPPGNFPPRPPQHGQNPQQHPIVLNPRFPQQPGPRPGAQQRPPYPVNYQPQQFRNVQRGPSVEGQEGLQHPPRPQEVAQRKQQRNESLLNAPRQGLPANEIENNRQPTRPRIVIEKMADVENANRFQMDSPARKTKTEIRENGQSDDDDDVVMDSKKISRSNGDATSGQGGLMESKSPKKNEDISSLSRPGTATLNGKTEMKLSETTIEKVNEKINELPTNSPEPVKLDNKVEEAGKNSNSIKIDDRPPSAKVDEKPEKIEKTLSDSRPSSGAIDNKMEDTSKEKSKEVEGTNEKIDPMVEGKDENQGKNIAVSSNAVLGETKSSVITTFSEDKTEKSDASRTNTPIVDHSTNEQTLKTPTKSPDKSRASTPAEMNQIQPQQELTVPSKSPDKSRASTPSEPSQIQYQQELTVPSKSPDKSRASTPSEVSQIQYQQELTVQSPDKSRASTPAEISQISNQQELTVPSKSPDKSRASTPAELEKSQNEEMIDQSKSPNKSRSSTPAMDQISIDEVKDQAKSPNKSRSSTPAMDQISIDESKDQAKSPNKSRSSTPAVDQTSNDELIDRSKSPNKSRSSTPAVDQTSNEELKVPPKTPESRASTPGGKIDTNTVETPGKPSENPHRDKPGKDSLEVNDADASDATSPTSEKTEEKSVTSPTTPDNNEKLPIPGSVLIPPKSPQDSVKGFDNGQRRSLSSRSSPCYSPQSPNAPKSPKLPIGSVKPPDVEKKRTTFAEEPKKDDDRKTGGKRTPKIQRAPTPAKLEDKMEKKLLAKQEVENGSAMDESMQSNAVPTTNGVGDSPTKKSPSKSKESDKRSTAGSPVKSPSKSAKSLPRTPETPSSTGSQEKKKLPMNKVQVGAAPSPNLKTVRSKIGSLDNASYKPGGGKVKIENRKLDFSKAQPKIAAKNEKYTPSGGEKKIAQVKLQWNAKPKVGSLDNATYKPGGGDKKIETVKLDFKDKAKPKVGSKDNAKHQPGGGAVKSSATPPKTPQDTSHDIQTQKVDIKAESKIGSLDNVKHKPGGGDKKIFNDKDYLRQTSSNVESLSGSGSQDESPEEINPPAPIEQTKEDLPQPPPTTPTKARNVPSPSSVVTPRAVRSGLAKSPDTPGPKRNFTPIDTATMENGSKKSPSSEDNKSVIKEKVRSPSSPRPPSSLRLKSPDKSSPATSRKNSPKELRLPKLAPSPIQQEITPIPETPSKISLPKLIEPSTQATRVIH